MTAPVYEAPILTMLAASLLAGPGLAHALNCANAMKSLIKLTFAHANHRQLSRHSGFPLQMTRHDQPNEVLT